MQTSKSYTADMLNEIGSLKLNCFSFLQNGMMPPRYTSDGININPRIYIEDIPGDAKSLAIIVEDPDVPHDSFCHWVAWNIPVTNQIKEKENRGIFGINDFGNHCYNGPHPFSIIHCYLFKVFALDCILNISISSTKTELKNAISGHIISFGTLIGKYKKQQKLQKSNILAKAKPILRKEWKTLLNETGTCVSLILPSSSLSHDQLANKLFLQKAVRQVCKQLSNISPENDEIINTLRKIEEEIIIHPNDKGVGIYVSNEINFCTGFPFEVSEKLIVNNCFHLTDLLIREQYSTPYNVLYIDDREIRLYSGNLNQLSEVKNKDLPMFFNDELDGQAQINSFLARNSYNKSFDKTLNEEKNRHQTTLQKANDVLQSYFQNSNALILCGVRKYLTEIVKSTGYTDKIISILYGNYNRFTDVDFSEMVWPIMKIYIEQEMTSEISEYDQKMVDGLTEEGITHVWNAILSDRGLTLLVEKNFEIEGFIDDKDFSRLYLHSPTKPHLVLPDAVDEIIKTALRKDLKIVFVENTMLSKHMRIALVTKF